MIILKNWYVNCIDHDFERPPAVGNSEASQAQELIYLNLVSVWFMLIKIIFSSWDIKSHKNLKQDCVVNFN